MKIDISSVSESAFFQNIVYGYGPKLLLAIVTFIVGLYLIGSITKAVDKLMQRKKWDPSLCSFFKTFLSVSLKVLLVITVAGMVGVATTSFIAVLGAAGLAVGLAFQNTLSNFAGSVLLLVFRPFKVGDLIEVDGRLGIVKEIQIFCTQMVTLDNKRVIIPNGKLASETIINLSTEDIKRIDLTFGIGYDDDLKKAKSVLNTIIAADSRVLSEPAPQVAVSELADSSVNFVFRPWVKTEDYWDVYFQMVENVKLEFDKEGISIPYPQQDIHIKTNEK